MLLVFAGACSFGILSTFVKVAYSQGHTADNIAGSQALCGALVLWALYLLRKPATGPSSSKAWEVLPAGASIGMTSYLYYLSVQYIPASVAIIFLMQFTWIGLLLEWIIYRKRPGRVHVLSICLIAAGTVMASGMLTQQAAPLPLKGILLVIASAAVYAVYVIVSGRVGNDMPVLKKSAMMMTGSAIAILLVARPGFIFQMDVWPALAGWSIFLALFGTIIPPVLFSAGIPRIGTALSAIIMTAELPVAILTSHLVLKEQVSLLQWCGVAIMLLAMILPNVRRM